MKPQELARTGIDVDAAVAPDGIVALVQAAVAESGADAQSTRRWVAIDGGTSADIRLSVASADEPAPLMTFAITTGRSQRGTAASSYVLDHTIAKVKRVRSLAGQETYLAFLRGLARLAVEADPGATVSMRVGAETHVVQAPPRGRAPEAPMVQDTPAVHDPIVVPEETTTVPDSVPASVPAPVSAAAPAAVRAAVSAASPGIPIAPAQPPESSDVVPPRIEVPPGLIQVPAGLLPGAPRAAPDVQVLPVVVAAPTPPVAPVVPVPVVPVPVAAAIDEATVVSPVAGGFILELPNGDPVALDSSVLIGRNPAAQPEYAGARLVAVLDPRMSVSKTHTAITVGRRALRVTDLHSTNGTTVTDASGAVVVCSPGTTVTAEPGSTITVGEFAIVVRRG
ncbi:FHA domain-containing protein [Plantibacter sp. YIM 135249]|uniref:FHA domain-containing protein n=1 Tax=Plantibacter sp. YIM 135249 TaxID=3423918 RepID=UPI003D358AE8